MKSLFASMIVVVSLVGCGGDGDGEPVASSSALELDEMSARALSGSYVGESGQLTFQARLDEVGIVLEVRDEGGELVSSQLEGDGHAFAFAGVPVAAMSGADADLTPIVALVDSPRWAAFEGLAEALDAALPHDDSPQSMLRKAFADARVTAELVAGSAEAEAGYSCWCMQWTTHCFSDPQCMSSSAGSCGTVCVSDCTSLWCD